jgi:hypothetical protein
LLPLLRLLRYLREAEEGAVADKEVAEEEEDASQEAEVSFSSTAITTDTGPTTGQLVIT